MDTPRIIAGDMEQSFALRFARRRGQAFVGWLSRYVQPRVRFVSDIRQLENRNHTAYVSIVPRPDAIALISRSRSAQHGP